MTSAPTAICPTLDTMSFSTAMYGLCVMVPSDINMEGPWAEEEYLMAASRTIPEPPMATPMRMKTSTYPDTPLRLASNWYLIPQSIKSYDRLAGRMSARTHVDCVHTHASRGESLKIAGEDGGIYDELSRVEV